MDFLALARERFSVRNYAPTPVEEEKVKAILEAASLAPTGCNRQPQRLLVVDDPQVLEAIRRCTPCQFHAPLTIVVCYDRHGCWVNPEGEPIGETDAAIVTTHMMLEAASLGLGCCWVAFFDRPKLQQELRIPKELVPVALLPLGYPAPQAKPGEGHFQHRPATDFTWWNHF